MRGITITYEYDGPEEEWESAVRDFIEAISEDADVSGKFVYQVAIADDGKTRIHWGRWDSQKTLKTMQSRPYFSAFADRLKRLAGGPPATISANVFHRTVGW